jgi:hypothetical protein
VKLIESTRGKCPADEKHSETRWGQRFEQMKAMKTNLLMISVLALITPIAHGQVLLSRGASYQENFDKLAAPPATNGIWADNETLPGWYAARESGTNAPHFKSYRVGSGDIKKGWIYSFGSEQGKGRNPQSDRAFGSIATASTGTIAFLARIAEGCRWASGRTWHLPDWQEREMRR